MENILVVFWSGTGNTKVMAHEIKDGIVSENHTVTLVNLKDCVPEVKDFNKIVIGFSATGKEEYDSHDVKPFLDNILPQIKDKKIALFGSYGWGNGKYMESVIADVKEANAQLIGTLLIKGAPTEKEAYAFGKQITQK